MKYRTEGLLEQTRSIPEDEFSINQAERVFPEERAASDFLETLKRQLTDLACWNSKSGLSTYDLFDRGGNKLGDTVIRPDSFINIKLTGTGKSDWVKVEDIFESPQELVITVKPSFDPTGNPQQTGRTSHFFRAEATNNFCAVKDGKTVRVYVIGLNERPNTQHTDGLFETARNAAVANLGYYLGIQKSEWTKFCEHFISGEDCK